MKKEKTQVQQILKALDLLSHHKIKPKVITDPYDGSTRIEVGISPSMAAAYIEEHLDQQLGPRFPFEVDAGTTHVYITGMAGGNPGRSSGWIQEAEKKMEAAGTSGTLTRKAELHGYESALSFARTIVKEWNKAKKTGFSPYVYNFKRGTETRIDTKLWRQANFAVNANKPKTKAAREKGRKALVARASKPRPMFSVRAKTTANGWRTVASWLTKAEANAECAKQNRQGFECAVFHGRKKS